MLIACSREVREITGSGGTSAHGATSSITSVTATVGSSDNATTASSASSGGDGGSGGVSTASSSGTVRPLTGDVLDPNEVYLVGSILPALINNQGVAHWSAPKAVVAGFEDLAGPEVGQVRFDGRLVYPIARKEPHLHEFRCDDCPYQGTYPAMPTANDLVIPAPFCDAMPNGAAGFMLSPDGAMIYTCFEPSHVWYNPNGTVAYTDPSYELRFLTYGSLGLNFADQLVDLATSIRITPTGLPPKGYEAARALPPPDAFLLLIEQTDGMGLDGSQEVWKMDRNGIGSFVGALPPLPPGTVLDPSFFSVFDGHGAVFQNAHKGDNGPFVVVRRTTTGESAIVIDSTDPQTLYVGGLFALVTGP